MIDDHDMCIEVNEAAERLEDLIDMLEAKTVRSILLTRNARPAAVMMLVADAH